MTNYAALEIELHHYDAYSYRVEASLKLPGEDAARQLSETIPRFDLDAYTIQASDPDAYGPMLTRALFATERLRIFFAQAQAAAMSQRSPEPLRLCLHIGPNFPDLHKLLWETLRDPLRPDVPLTLDENVLFSRYLTSQDWRAVRPQPRGDLHALVVVANPADLDQWKPGKRPLAPLDVDGELERAKTGLSGMPVTTLASGGSATLEGIVAQLREGADFFYLACHGALLNDGPHLWLENDAGMTDRVPGAELVARLRDMRQLPRLVVLASCQSAGQAGTQRSDDGGALAALGPRLAEVGIPAVLAMQGNVTMTTVEQFMPVFFRELQRDGQIDRAVTVARGNVRQRHDWWVPVLFTRLESGQLFTPEAPEDTDGPGELPQGEGYDLNAVRELLMAGFNARTLPRMIRFSRNRDLSSLVNQFSPNDGLVDIVVTTLDYCEDQGLLGALLVEVKRENPNQYARFEPRLRAQETTA
jgi:hypothetical protein